MILSLDTKFYARLSLTTPAHNTTNRVGKRAKTSQSIPKHISMNALFSGHYSIHRSSNNLMREKKTRESFILRNVKKNTYRKVECIANDFDNIQNSS